MVLHLGDHAMVAGALGILMKELVELRRASQGDRQEPEKKQQRYTGRFCENRQRFGFIPSSHAKRKLSTTAWQAQARSTGP